MKRTRFKLIQLLRTSAALRVIGISAVTWLIPSANANEVLFDFNQEVNSQRIFTTDAKVSIVKAGTGKRARIETGHKEQWPGIRLESPTEHWDLSAFASVSIELRNCGTNQVTIYCRVDNPGADGSDHCVTGSRLLGPGVSGTLFVPLKRANDDKLGGKLFGMRGYPVSPGGQGTVDPKNVNQLLLFVSKPNADHAFEIGTIAATGDYTAPTASVADASPYFPFIDTLGQYRHKDWPGKTRSVPDLQNNRAEEEKDLAANPGPKDWDKYGGWETGPTLKSSRFFRTEKTNGKWWLVDPEGRLFFSHGIDCVRSVDSTPTEERESWFEDFPGKDAEYTEFLTHGYALKGHYAGKTVACFSFAAANLRRKYGSSWVEEHPKIVHRRLRSWGLNTIANWSDERTYLMRKTAYTDAIGSTRAKMIEGSEGYWGKFPDVFDPSFAEALRRSMEAKRGKSAGDPWCIGYFSDNEMSWGDELSLALGALKSKPTQVAKKAFMAELQGKYGEIAKLNEVWGTTYASWESLANSGEAPDQSKAHDDLAAFYTMSAEKYFRTVRDTIKAVAPNQLYLGCRFAWVNSRAAAAAAKYCDVVSYNLYQRSVADFKFNGGADVPIIIGEFHFGALDRGMFHTGLVPVANQEERAMAYREYVLGALRHPQFVGCHWFQYADEPVTGRAYDEENYQIGFVDVADTPYKETIAASREVGYALYGRGAQNR